MEITPKIRPIVAYNHPVLRQPCIPAEDNEETRQLVADLIETTKQISTGAGLSAQQVGSTLAVFVIRKGGTFKAFVNPVIEKTKGTKKYEEGCLSLPEVFAVVERPDKIEITYWDENFIKHTKVKYDGFDSIVIQHELDHINGILFIDHLSEQVFASKKEKLDEIEQGKIRVRYPMMFNPETLIEK